MKYSYLTDIGKIRQVNEDSVGFFTNQKSLYLGIVADGIGGNRGGDVASSMVVHHIGYLFEESTFDDVAIAYRWLQEQIQVENDLLITKGKQYIDLEGMGTTLVCILGSASKCVIANIGDSRGYRLRNDELTQVTQDHSLVNELVKEGAITAKEAVHHPQKNVIVKTLGINHDAQMNFYPLAIKSNDSFLLCTDGLTNMVGIAKIKEILTDNDDPTVQCQQLITQARVNGGADNITTLIVEFDESGDQQCE